MTFLLCVEDQGGTYLLMLFFLNGCEGHTFWCAVFDKTRGGTVAPSAVDICDQIHMIYLNSLWKMRIRYLIFFFQATICPAVY